MHPPAGRRSPLLTAIASLSPSMKRPSGSRSPVAAALASLSPIMRRSSRQQRALKQRGFADLEALPAAQPKRPQTATLAKRPQTGMLRSSSAARPMPPPRERATSAPPGGRQAQQAEGRFMGAVPGPRLRREVRLLYDCWAQEQAGPVDESSIAAQLARDKFGTFESMLRLYFPHANRPAVNEPQTD